MTQNILLSSEIFLAISPLIQEDSCYSVIKTKIISSLLEQLMILFPDGKKMILDVYRKLHDGII